MIWTLKIYYQKLILFPYLLNSFPDILLFGSLVNFVAAVFTFHNFVIIVIGEICFGCLFIPKISINFFYILRRFDNLSLHITILPYSIRSRHISSPGKPVNILQGFWRFITNFSDFGIFCITLSNI